MVSKSSSNTDSNPSATDWEGIERDYRAGVLSAREMGGLYGVSHTAILKRAKASGWERNIQAKIQAKAEAKVSKAAVSASITAGIMATESQIVEANAEAISRVRLAHRQDINGDRLAVNRLLAEADLLSAALPTLEELKNLVVKAARSADAPETAREVIELFRRFASVPVRMKTRKDAADIRKTLVALERESWGLVANQPPTAPVKELTDDALSDKINRLLGITAKPGAAPAAHQTLQ